MRWKRVPCAAALLVSGLAAPVDAAPIQTLVIQPIQVCDDAGLICAPTDVFDLAVTQAIFAQASINIAVAGPIKRFNRSDFLTVDTVAGNASPTDEARTLLRGPHLGALGVSAVSTTINVFIVDELREVTLGGAPTAVGTGMAGFGFINANGIILDRGARRDTLAHEIGHNLGLPHIADPLNLMADGYLRPSLTNIADVAPGGAKLDQLSTPQIERVRSPLFTLNLARAVGEPDALTAKVDCVGNLNCLYITFPIAVTSERLTQIALNFRPGTDVDGLFARIVGPTPVATLPPGAISDTTLADGTVRITFDLRGVTGGGIAPGGEMLLALSSADRVTRPIDPQSIFFGFSSGILSTALYDGTSAVASDEPDQVAFLGSDLPPSVGERPLADAGSVELGGDFLAALTPADIAEFLRLGIFDAGETGAAVPAPASLTLLAIALGVLGGLRRRVGVGPALIMTLCLVASTSTATVVTAGSVAPVPLVDGTTSPIIVGNGASGALTIDAGSDLTTNGSQVFIGQGAAGSGALAVTGSGSTLTINNNRGARTVLQVGNLGAASATIADGARVVLNPCGCASPSLEQTFLLVRGNAALGRTATLTVTGTGSSIDLLGTGGPSIGVGDSGGDATLRILDGGRITGFNANLGGAATTAALVIDGAGSQLRLAGTDATSATRVANLAAGIGVDARVSIAVTRGGTLAIDETAAVFPSGGLQLGRAAGATVDMTVDGAGSRVVLDGPPVGGGGLTVARIDGSRATMTVRNGGSVAITGSGAGIAIGQQNGDGTLAIGDGGTVMVDSRGGSAAAGSIIVGLGGSASQGRFDLSGATARATIIGDRNGGDGRGPGIVVARNGSGTLRVLGGAQLTAQGDGIATGWMTIGGSTRQVIEGSAAGSGTALVSGDGSRIDVVGAGALIDVGHSGSGTLTIADGATLRSAGGVWIGRNAGSAGSVRISAPGLFNATLEAATPIFMSANPEGGAAGSSRLILDDGIVIAPRIEAFAGAMITGNGIVLGSIVLHPGAILGPGFSPGTIAIDGDLTLEAGASLQLDYEAAADGSVARDRLVVGGRLTLDGDVVIALGGEATLADLVGESLLDFFAVDDPTLGTRLEGRDLIVDPGDGPRHLFAMRDGGLVDLGALAEVPAPATMHLLLTATLALAAATRRAGCRPQLCHHMRTRL